AYEQAGAVLVENRDDILRSCDLILGHDSHYRGEDFGVPKTFIGFFNVLSDRPVVEPYLKPGITMYSLDLIPRSTLPRPWTCCHRWPPSADTRPCSSPLSVPWPPCR